MKRGALELSVSTIVIVILAVSMLVLGLYMPRSLMCGSINGIEEINENMRGTIRGLFNPNEKLVIKEFSNEISKDVEYGVGFAIRNIDSDSEDFSYNVLVSDLSECSFSEADAMSFIILGSSSNIRIPHGEDYVGLIRFRIPSRFENCNVRYSIEVKEGDSVYAFKEFDVAIRNKKFTQNLC